MGLGSCLLAFVLCEGTPERASKLGDKGQHPLGLESSCLSRERELHPIVIPKPRPGKGNCAEFPREHWPKKPQWFRVTCLEPLLVGRRRWNGGRVGRSRSCGRFLDKYKACWRPKMFFQLLGSAGPSGQKPGREGAGRSALPPTFPKKSLGVHLQASEESVRWEQLATSGPPAPRGSQSRQLREASQASPALLKNTRCLRDPGFPPGLVSCPLGWGRPGDPRRSGLV